MRSTKPGIPCNVAAIRPSSSWAGTTTATRFPSSMTRSYGSDRLGRSQAADPAVSRDRRDPAEDQPDQGADHDRAALRVRREEHRRGRLDDLGALDVLRERQLLLGRRLLVEQVPLALLSVVDLAHEDELVQRIEIRLRQRGLQCREPE